MVGYLCDVASGILGVLGGVALFASLLAFLMIMIFYARLGLAAVGLTPQIDDDKKRRLADIYGKLFFGFLVSFFVLEAVGELIWKLSD